MARAGIVAIIFAVAITIESNPTLACTCELEIAAKPVRQYVYDARKQATAVFSGQVRAVTRQSSGGEQALFVRVRFEVDRVWKGQIGAEAFVVTGLGGGDCGVRFEEGETYLLYCYGGSSALETNICMRTRPVSAATDDLLALGRGKSPTPSRTMPN